MDTEGSTPTCKTISLPSVLSLPRAVLLLAATILPAVLAANAQALAVYTWPPNAASPPYMLLVNVGGGNVPLSYTLETSMTAAADPCMHQHVMVLR